MYYSQIPSYLHDSDLYLSFGDVNDDFNIDVGDEYPPENNIVTDFEKFKLMFLVYNRWISTSGYNENSFKIFIENNKTDVLRFLYQNEDKYDQAKILLNSIIKSKFNFEIGLQIYTQPQPVSNPLIWISEFRKFEKSCENLELNEETLNFECTINFEIDINGCKSSIEINTILKNVINMSKEAVEILNDVTSIKTILTVYSIYHKHSLSFLPPHKSNNLNIPHFEIHTPNNTLRIPLYKENIKIISDAFQKIGK